jgi:hypothetical protein
MVTAKPAFPSPFGRVYITKMSHNLLAIALGIALFAVLAILLIGVAVFMRGGVTNQRWSLRLMNLRVATQAVAVLLLGLLLLRRYW